MNDIDELAESLVPIIGVGIFGLIVIAVLLKILSKHYLAIKIFMCLAAVGIIVSSFCMPHTKKGEPLQPGWILAQAIFIFLYCVISCAWFAFDEEEYLDTKSIGFDSEGNQHFETKLASRSLFWTVLGIGLFVTAVLLLLNYVIIGTNAIGLGVVGCIAELVAVIGFISFFVKKRRRRDYY